MSTPQVLEGVRVLDLSRVLAGPWASQMLADMGAEVIKVERPDSGDDTRSWGPPWWKSEAGQASAEAAYFSCANRGKRSITVNLANPVEQDKVRQLVGECDVLIENFKVGGLKAYGLDYESLKLSNPRLIYCSITGFGQTGPLAKHAGYDFMIQAMGGLMSVTGASDQDGGKPQKVGVALADILTGLYASNAILAALHWRNQSGLGQHIDLALLDVQVACLANQASNYLASGSPPGRMGNAHPNIVPYQSFAAADGHFILAVGNDAQFERLATVLDHPEWASQKTFATNAERVKHRADLVPLIQAIVAQKSRKHWLSVFENEGIPCGAINNVAEAIEHPQTQSRGMTAELPHASLGMQRMVVNPIKFSETPIQYTGGAPILGQHNSEYFGE